ncbi:MAG: WIAG-tail domain [Candidatus Pristimantibacillus sp.]
MIKQQFGLTPYNFNAQDEHIDIIIMFDEPYETEEYVITASSDHPACYAVVHSKTTDSAIVSLIRTRISFEPSGCVNWIAIGR